MATLYGYEVSTPDEVLAQTHSAYEAKKMQDPSNPQIAMSQAIFNLVGSPELSKARATSSALSNALSSFKPPDGADEITTQLAQATHVRNQMASVNPELALQANDKILSLQNEQMQQQSLKDNSEYNKLRLQTAGLDHADAVRVAEQAKQKIIFKRNLTSGAVVPVSNLPEDSTPEEAIASLQAEQAKGDSANYAYSLGTGIDLWKVSDAFRPYSLGRAGAGGAFGSSTLTSPELRGLRGQLDSASNTMNALSRVGNTLKQDLFSANALTGKSASGVLNVLDAGERLYNEYAAVAKPEDAAYSSSLLEDRLKDPEAQSKIEEAARRMGVDSSVVQAQVKAAAYSLAKTLDGGGRLSDKDVELAMEMIVGNGDPQVVADLFQERLAALSDVTAQAFYAADQGHLGPEGNFNKERFQKSRDAFAGTISDLRTEIAKRGVEAQRRNPPPNGATATTASTPSGVPQVDQNAVQAELARRKAARGG